MIYDKSSNTITLSTGRAFYAHECILGLNDNGERLHLTYGYDGYVGADDPYDPAFETQLSPAERQEIADHMVERWKAWAKLSPATSEVK